MGNWRSKHVDEEEFVKDVQEMSYEGKLAVISQCGSVVESDAYLFGYLDRLITSEESSNENTTNMLIARAITQVPSSEYLHDLRIPPLIIRLIKQSLHYSHQHALLVVLIGYLKGSWEHISIYNLMIAEEVLQHITCNLEDQQEADHFYHLATMLPWREELLAIFCKLAVHSHAHINRQSKEIRLSQGNRSLRSSSYAPPNTPSSSTPRRPFSVAPSSPSSTSISISYRPLSIAPFGPLSPAPSNPSPSIPSLSHLVPSSLPVDQPASLSASPPLISDPPSSPDSIISSSPPSSSQLSSASVTFAVPSNPRSNRHPRSSPRTSPYSSPHPSPPNSSLPGSSSKPRRPPPSSTSNNSLSNLLRNITNFPRKNRTTRKSAVVSNQEKQEFKIQQFMKLKKLHPKGSKAPWFIDPVLLPKDYANYCIIDARKKHLKRVAELYSRCPVDGYDIKSVRVVSNERLTSLFSDRVQMLEKRSSQRAFKPSWTTDSKSDKEREQRQGAFELFRSLSHSYAKAPHVSLIPVWHGTNPDILDSLFTTGFANLATTDAGFFGKGIYGTPDAEYAHRVYSSGILLINWVAVFSAFPVIYNDEEELSEKANFSNYDAHFAPVYSPHHPNTRSYHACNYNEQHQYSELVVFDSAQVLPQFIVELQPSLIPNPNPRRKSTLLTTLIKGALFKEEQDTKTEHKMQVSLSKDKISKKDKTKEARLSKPPKIKISPSNDDIPKAERKPKIKKSSSKSKNK